jgi:hypothetical protein
VKVFTALYGLTDVAERARELRDAGAWQGTRYCRPNTLARDTETGYGATVNQSANPDGSWRPSAPCS